MAESQKKAASTSKSQKSNSLLDEEIGKEFLGSWKSMSMVEDDAQVFNCKTMSKGKKSTFIFDKLDMDFSIDGDFGKKISSFKVDMSDLDFSSPPKKPLKPKERQKQESSSGKLEEKQDDFAFAFDFDELDNFDLDLTMMKGEKKSDKFVNDKGSDSPVKNAEKQDSRSIFAASTEATENSTTNTSAKLKHVDLKSECLRGALGSLDSPGDDYSMPENLGNLNVSEGKKTPPHKEITNSANGEDHYIKRSQMASSTGTNGLDTIKYSCVQPVTGVDANQESFQESQVDIYPSAAETNVSLGGGQDNGCKQIAGLEAKLANASNLDGSPLACIAGSQNTKNEFENLENQNGASPGFINRKESVQCDRAIARISQRKPHTPMPTMERKISGSKLPLAQLLSGPKVNKDMPLRGKGPSSICSQFFKGLQEKGPSSICSQFFKGSEETGSQVNKNDMHQIPADARRQDNSTGDSKAGNQKFNTSNDSSETEGLPITLGSVKKNEDHKASAGFQVHVARSPKRATNLGSLKCINSELIASVALTKNSRSTSVEGGKPSSLESGNKPLHIAGLKVSRSVLSSNNLFTLRPQKQIKSQWQSEGNNTMHEHVAGKMVHAVSADIQVLSGPSMKRKISEEPNADPMTQHPLKRITDLPNESRTLEAVEEDKKQVGDNKNLLEDYHSISTLDASHDTSLIELEVPSLMENNGNVQKAEACAKELEDICKILKKKHEEAKEVLVRAIVNNNNLLMLNHPSYEVKISFH